MSSRDATIKILTRLPEFTVGATVTVVLTDQVQRWIDAGFVVEIGEGFNPGAATIDAVLEWVGDDDERAALALTAEQAKDKPRERLIETLTDKLNAGNPAPDDLHNS